nr:tyrosine-type recombinase/integrase [uncultured Aminipila sp.]
MASKTNCVINGKAYYRIRRKVGVKLNKEGLWVDDIKPFYGKNKSDAERQYQEFQESKKLGMPKDTKQYFGIAFDFFVYQVLVIDTRFANGTREKYESAYRLYIKPSFLSGNLLNDVQTADIQKFYNEVDCSQSILKSIHNVMGHFYKYLQHQGLSRNMTDGLVIPAKQKNSKKNNQEVVVWTDEELEKILTNLGENRIRFLIVMASYTGCRLSELLALKYTDICNGIVNISKQLSLDTKIKQNETTEYTFQIAETKTSSSNRSIPVPDLVMSELEQHQSWHKAEMLKNGYRTEYIFTTASGNFYYRRNITRACERYYKKIGVEYKEFHTYRRTFCSNLAKNGVKLQVAYQLMGHSSINVTAKYYINVDDEDKRNAIEKLPIARIKL